jgi:hypothetical protein
MSPLAIPSSATAALSAVNVHPHRDGHKKDSQLDLSTDSSSSTAAQIPVATAKSLFGSLFNSLQQLLGVQPLPAAAGAAAASKAGAAAASKAGAATGASAAAASKIDLMA